VLFYVNAPIYLIILLENQVFIPDLLVGKLSHLYETRGSVNNYERLSTFFLVAQYWGGGKQANGHMEKSRSIMSSKSDLNGYMEKNRSVIPTEI